MDTIRIDKLIFSGKHGVYEEERNLEQEFEINVSFDFDTQRAAESDSLEDLVDYEKIRDLIKNTVEEHSYFLIEKLGDTIAKKILEDQRIPKVTVEIRKMNIWGNGVPAVSITRLK